MKNFEVAVCGEMGNDFDEKNFEVICKDLEEGKAVWLYCWCTGHTRCAMVEWNYLQKLKAKYGDRFKEGRYGVWNEKCYYLEGGVNYEN